ncbi:MAG: hypothetical protein AMXMBFR82_34380 [Candidatus Hydrogenedentota bacterium]
MLWKLRKVSDAEIVRRVLAGKRDEFGVLVERYLAVVQAVAYARTGNRADAQDVAQDTFLTAFEKLDTVRDVASIGAWLTTIARHRAVRLMQQRQRRVELQERNLPQEPEVHMPSPEKAEIRELLRQEVLRLDEDYREVLMLHYFAGKKIREVAALLDISVDAAKKRLQRAREALSASLTTQLPELLETDKPREKQVSRIMGIVALATPSWQGATATIAGGAAVAGGAMVLKVTLAATALVVSGGLWWTWRASDTDADRLPVVETRTASTNSADSTESPSDSRVAAQTSQETTPPPSQSLSEAFPNIAAELKELFSSVINEGLSVSGTVIDTAGNPVPSAKVVVHIDDPYRHEEIEADVNGKFAVGDLPQTHSLYTVAISPKHEPLLFESDVEGPFELQDTGVTGVVLTLDRPRNRTMSGVVVSENGDPLEGVGVLASAQRLRPSGGNVWTDARGMFSIPGLAAGNYRIGLSPPGHESWRIKGDSPVYTIPVDVDLTGLVVTYEDLGTLVISGRITDTKGNPVSGARLEAMGAKATRESPERSNREGRFTIDGLPSGDDYRVTAYHNKYTTQEIADVSAGQTDVNFVLAGRGGVTGTVVDARTDLPIPAFEIGYSAEITSARGTQYTGIRWESVENADGVFSLRDLQSLRTNLYAKAAGYSPNQVRVEITPGSTMTGITLRLASSPKIDGIVVDSEGSPIAGAMAFYGGLPHLSDRERTAAARTPEDGRFTLDTFPEDATGFTVYHPDYAPITVSLSENNADPYRVILEEGGSLTGRLSIAGAPPGSAYLNLGYSSLGYPLNINTQASATGEYAFPHLPEGDVRLDVTMYSAEDPQTKRTVTRILHVESTGETTFDIDLAELTASLEGIVTLNGAPIVDAWVALEVGPDGEAEYFRTQTDLDGAYVIEQSPGGPVNVIIGYEAEGIRYHRQMNLLVQSDALSRWDVDLTDSDVLEMP